MRKSIVQNLEHIDLRVLNLIEESWKKCRLIIHIGKLQEVATRASLVTFICILHVASFLTGFAGTWYVILVNKFYFYF